MNTPHDGPPDPESLRRLLINCEPVIRYAWDNRSVDTDILVLADARLDLYRERLLKEWGEDLILNACIGANRDPEGGRPMFAFVEPRTHLIMLERSEDPDRRRAAGELRVILPSGHADGPPYVPMMVAFQEGILVTEWCPSGTLGQVVEISPFVDYTAN